MTTLHLRITDFKFTHNFIVCDRLPDTEIMFGIDIQKKLLQSYAWTKRRIATSKRMADFSHTHLAQRDAQPCGSGRQLNMGANEMGRKTPSVVEWASSSLPGPYGMWLLWCSCPNSQWQATAFRLPQAQVEASGWWEALHSQNTLCHQGFLPQVDSPGMRDFHATRQEETLALALALQQCVERLGMPLRVLCEPAWDLQRFMAPLMWLNSDDIVEASLFGPTNNRPITSPSMEEEAVLWGDEQ